MTEEMISCAWKDQQILQKLTEDNSVLFQKLNFSGKSDEWKYTCLIFPVKQLLRPMIPTEKFYIEEKPVSTKKVWMSTIYLGLKLTLMFTTD